MQHLSVPIKMCALIGSEYHFSDSAKLCKIFESIISAPDLCIMQSRRGRMVITSGSRQQPGHWGRCFGGTMLPQTAPPVGSDARQSNPLPGCTESSSVLVSKVQQLWLENWYHHGYHKPCDLQLPQKFSCVCSRNFLFVSSFTSSAARYFTSSWGDFVSRHLRGCVYAELSRTPGV